MGACADRGQWGHVLGGVSGACTERGQWGHVLRGVSGGMY